MAKKTKPIRQALPKGLQEFECSLHDLQFTEELLKRLLKLPGKDFSASMQHFRDGMRVVEAAETAAGTAREAARRTAFRMWAQAVKGCSVEELQIATGYTDE